MEKQSLLESLLTAVVFIAVFGAAAGSSTADRSTGLGADASGVALSIGPIRFAVQVADSD